MVVIFVEAANGNLLFAAPQLALDVVVFPAVAGFQPQSAVGPELSFGAETMRGLDQCHRQSRANRSQGGNLPQFAVIVCLRLSASSSRRACWRKCCSMSSC